MTPVVPSEKAGADQIRLRQLQSFRITDLTRVRRELDPEPHALRARRCGDDEHSELRVEVHRLTVITCTVISQTTVSRDDSRADDPVVVHDDEEIRATTGPLCLDHDVGCEFMFAHDDDRH